MFCVYVCRLTRSPLTRHLQKKLSGHPNIVQFCSAASIGKEESDTGQAEFLLLTELCRGNALPADAGPGGGRPCPGGRERLLVTQRRGGVVYMTEEEAAGFSLPALPMEGRAQLVSV